MNLYKQLFSLCEYEGTPFYFKDHYGTDGNIYRIFLYRHATYTDFCRPGALEARGTMFRLGYIPKLVCLPMEKFFNLGENESTNYGLDHVLDNGELFTEKKDGSLINSYLDSEGNLKLKTKGSLNSDQALAAMDHLRKDEFLTGWIKSSTACGWTVNMEWTSPHNRVVLGYDHSRLTILNLRNMETGEYMPTKEVGIIFGGYAVREVTSEQVKDYRAQTGIEGYVYRLQDGSHGKLKTDWYCHLHHNKESVSTPRRLLNACLDNVTDDLKQLFEDDRTTIHIIEDMEFNVRLWIATLSSTVDIFHEDYKHLSRKEYAIKGNKTLTKTVFGATMVKYSGGEPDYASIIKKNWKEYLGE